MVHVIATIELHDGKRDGFIKLFRQNVGNVIAEEGCVAYAPAVDLETGIGSQVPVRPNVVTVLEHWRSLDDLRAHLKAPHMAAYRERVKDLVKSVSLQVLEPA